MTRELYEVIKKDLYTLNWSEYAHSFDMLLQEQKHKHNLTDQDLLDFEGFEIADEMNAQEEGTLKGYECPICRNRGYNYHHEILNGHLNYYAKDCICKKLRAEFARLEKCGISQRLVEKYRFDTFIPRNGWQVNLKDLALKFLNVVKSNKNSNDWFIVAGTSGAGKSHISTAIYIELLKSGRNVKFMAWRDGIDSLKLWKKSSYQESQRKYEQEMQELKTIDVLYIDDFLKFLPNAGYERDQELDLAYSIINARYSNGLVTIISTEELLDSLETIDTAIAKRITERAGNFCIQLKGSDKDQRR